jgi:hypothetical protein
MSFVRGGRTPGLIIHSLRTRDPGYSKGTGDRDSLQPASLALREREVSESREFVRKCALDAILRRLRAIGPD